MYRFWHSILEPAINILQPANIVEIGCDRGSLTQCLLSYCAKHKAVLHAIDPAPGEDMEKLIKMYPSVLSFHRDISLHALPAIEKIDMVLIDGDHNWYTVHKELQILQKKAAASGYFPTVFLHDTGWPYGRRDMYYNPEKIPSEHRHAYAQHGLIPGQSILEPNKGINKHLYNALEEGAVHSGVLAAVKDFLHETSLSLELHTIPGFHGMGILVSTSLLEKNPALQHYCSSLKLPSTLKRHIQAMEKSRIELWMDYEAELEKRKSLELMALGQKELMASAEEKKAQEQECHRVALEGLSKAEEARQQLLHSMAALEKDLLEEKQRHAKSAEAMVLLKKEFLLHKEKQAKEAEALEQRIATEHNAASMARALLEQQKTLMGEVKAAQQDTNNRLLHMHTTRSWRWTAPLRKIDTFMQRHRNIRLIHVGFLRKKIAVPEQLTQLLNGPPKNTYDAYCAWNAWSDKKKAESEKSVQELSTSPLISIVMPVFRTDVALLRQTIDSIYAQTYQHWELIIAFDGIQPDALQEAIIQLIHQGQGRIRALSFRIHGGISRATNAGAAAAKGEFIALVDDDDLLEPDALQRIATALDKRPDTDFFYTDHDKISTDGRRYDPEFKPDWSPETLLSYCYIGHMKVIRRSLFTELGGFRPAFDGAQDYDFCLRLAERTDNIVHVPGMLYHWRSSPGSVASGADAKPESIERGRLAVEDAVKRRGIRAQVMLPAFAHKSRIGVYGLRFSPLESQKKVTIIIPTKNNPALLERCINSIHSKTNYSHYQILVIDGGRENRRINAFLRSSNALHLRMTGEPFNYARINNVAAKSVDSPLILFLNDDTEVLAPDWLTQMVGTLSMNGHIGAVGAKLIYENGRTQHSGVVLGLGGVAGHLNKLLHQDDFGHLYSNVSLRNFSAVTAACMLTKRELFLELGGFDEDHFPAPYNDVDYCLRLQKAGYRIACEPQAMLVHYEGATRGRPHALAERPDRERLYKRWRHILDKDPYYHQDLSLALEQASPRQYEPGKRLLLVSHNLNYEGAPLFLLALAKQLRHRGYHPAVISPQEGPLRQEYEKIGIKVLIDDMRKAHHHASFMQEFDAAIVNTIVCYPFIQEAETGSLPMIWCIHESERDQYFKQFPDLQEQDFSKADKVIFVADATRNIYADLDKGHFHTIYNGLDLREIDCFRKENERNALRQALYFTAGDTVITCVGTICPRKGQKEIVDAFALLRKKFPHESLRLQLIGGGADARYENSIRENIKAYGLENFISIIPHTHDVRPYYGVSDMFVCGSSIESFPTIILEAMAWALPIVSTNVFGIPEQITHEQEGLLTEPNNPKALAVQMGRLLKDKNLASKLAKKAREKIELSFQLSRVADNYEALLAEIKDSECMAARAS